MALQMGEGRNLWNLMFTDKQRINTDKTQLIANPSGIFILFWCQTSISCSCWTFWEFELHPTLFIDVWAPPNTIERAGQRWVGLRRCSRKRFSLLVQHLPFFSLCSFFHFFWLDLFTISKSIEGAKLNSAKLHLLKFEHLLMPLPPAEAIRLATWRRAESNLWCGEGSSPYQYTRHCGPGHRQPVPQPRQAHYQHSPAPGYGLVGWWRQDKSDNAGSDGTTRYLGGGGSGMYVRPATSEYMDLQESAVSAGYRASFLTVEVGSRVMGYLTRLASLSWDIILSRLRREFRNMTDTAKEAINGYYLLWKSRNNRSTRYPLLYYH